MPQEREQLPSVPAQVAKPGWLVWAGSAYQSWCPAVAMPTPRLCLRMLYLISHVWNSNYVISQHRVAMTAGPTFPGWLTPWGGEEEGPAGTPQKPQLRSPLKGGGQECGCGKHWWDQSTSIVHDGEIEVWVVSTFFLTPTPAHSPHPF